MAISSESSTEALMIMVPVAEGTRVFSLLMLAISCPSMISQES